MSAVTDDLQRLADCVRRNLLVEPTSITDVGELSNINYVYRVETPDSSFYLKVIPEQPKRLPVKLPRERVFSEAAGLRLYREFAGADLVVPEVLFVDGDEMALAMSDVGGGRQILFQVIAEDFQLLAEQGDAIGRALGRIHAATRGRGTPRPAEEEMIIRKVIFDGLLAPGAKLAFPELWDDVRAEMEAHKECLIHADLWSKNLLVAHGAPMAVVDFEGIVYGDPAFDLGTLTAVALVPALDRQSHQSPLPDPKPREKDQREGRAEGTRGVRNSDPSPYPSLHAPQPPPARGEGTVTPLLPSALDFVSRLCASWSATCGDPEWARAVLPRTFRATATFLAARGFGPFAYAMSDAARQQIRAIARDLASNPPANFEQFRRALECGGNASALQVTRVSYEAGEYESGRDASAVQP